MSHCIKLPVGANLVLRLQSLHLPHEQRHSVVSFRRRRRRGGGHLHLEVVVGGESAAGPAAAGDGQQGAEALVDLAEALQLEDEALLVGLAAAGRRLLRDAGGSRLALLVLYGAEAIVVPVLHSLRHKEAFLDDSLFFLQLTQPFHLEE